MSRWLKPAASRVLTRFQSSVVGSSATGCPVSVTKWRSVLSKSWGHAHGTRRYQATSRRHMSGSVKILVVIFGPTITTERGLRWTVSSPVMMVVKLFDPGRCG